MQDAGLVGVRIFVVPQSGRGFFGIGIEYPRTAKNVGTLWRTAHHESRFHICDRQYKPVATIPGEFSLNVSVAGIIVLYDRLLKNGGFGV